MTVSIATARDIAKRLINAEASGPGDYENAMYRLQGKYGLSFSFLHSLKYRPPNDILLSQWMRLLDVYEMKCAQQERLFQEERKTARALKDATSKTLVSAADFVAGKQT